MNKTKIEWCDMTWNPVVGCCRGCSYCYAKRMNDRFMWIPKWDEPTFFPTRLNEPIKVKKGSTIFVGSVTDVCYWKPDWMDSVLEVIESCKQHQFMFLTKNLKMLEETMYDTGIVPCRCLGGGDWIENLWIGLTLTKPPSYDFKRAFDFWPGKTFISIEPLLDDFTGIGFGLVDLVIVGAMTGPGAIEPKPEWIKSIKHHNIFYKSNIKPLSPLPKHKGIE